jgi:sarcosine oxidase delta subunit
MTLSDFVNLPDAKRTEAGQEVAKRVDEMMSEMTLVPCPFCGSRPHVQPKHPKIEGDAWTSIGCSNLKECGQASVTVYAEKGHRDEAAKRWNRRAHIAQHAEMARDAARVDWLARVAKTSSCDMGGNHPWNLFTHKLAKLRGPTFRAAIDAAMTGESP